MKQIRCVRKSDKYGLIGIQRAVYPPPFSPSIWHWNYDQLKSQLKAQHFCIVIDDNLELVGSIAAFRTDREKIEGQTTWDEITDGGHFHKHNELEGDTIYLADIAIKPKCRNHEGTALLNALKKLAEIYRVKYIIGGARLSESYKCEYFTPLEYALAVKEGIERDKTTEFFKSNGFRLGKILPNYITDHESRNHAIEIIWERETDGEKH